MPDTREKGECDGCPIHMGQEYLINNASIYSDVTAGFVLYQQPAGSIRIGF